MFLGVLHLPLSFGSGRISLATANALCQASACATFMPSLLRRVSFAAFHAMKCEPNPRQTDSVTRGTVSAVSQSQYI